MRRALLILLAIIAVVAVYLLFAPVPVSPVAWEAPEDPGTETGLYRANTALADLSRIPLGGGHGPEDIAARDGLLYTSSQDGEIFIVDPNTGTVREFARTGGVPLGIEFDGEGSLLVADAYLGLLRVSPEGEVETLADTVDGTPILYADDVDVAPDGRIVFTDASTKFGAEEYGSTLGASLYEILEHGATGRVLVHDPATGETSVLADGMSFPNGIVITADGSAALVNITGEYNTLRVPLDGGPVTEFAGPYPGFPDNINRGPDVDGEATYLVGLVSPRSKALDDLAGNPGARKMVQRLPAFMRPQAESYTHIVVLGEDGRVLASLQDPAGGYAQATGAVAVGGRLYLSSLTEPDLAYRSLPDSLK